MFPPAKLRKQMSFFSFIFTDSRSPASDSERLHCLDIQRSNPTPEVSDTSECCADFSKEVGPIAERALPLIESLAGSIQTIFNVRHWSSVSTKRQFVLLEGFVRSHLRVDRIENCTAVHGCTYWSRQNATYRIFINRSAPLDQQVFTLSHEIAHVLLHIKTDGKGQLQYPERIGQWVGALRSLKQRTRAQEEVEADYFADCLLRFNLHKRTFAQRHDPVRYSSISEPNFERSSSSMLRCG
jgi:hypothetical protein